MDLVPRDTSYLQTDPLDDLLDLWGRRLERMSKFVLMNAPQQIIDRERMLITEVRTAWVERTNNAAQKDC